MPTKKFIIFCFLFACRSHFVFGDNEKDWRNFKETHGKKYMSPEEEDFRKTVYIDNLEFIQEWNERYKLGEVTFFMGENQYSDLTEEEYNKLKSMKLPRKIVENAKRSSPFRKRSKGRKNRKQFEPIHLRQLPVNCTVDLRNDTCLAPVKNQGQCGSCYTFPATCLIEFAYCIKRNLSAAIPFSEQQCLDCTKMYGNYGCNGGYYEGCWNYWKNTPIMNLSSYPYTAKAAKCKAVFSLGQCNVANYTPLKAWDEAGMETNICTFRQPIAVAIHATSYFNAYRGGLFTDPSCANYLINKSTSANHAVTVVGIGMVNGTAAWIVRNSWGPSWGDKGYIWMKKGDNTCNIGLDPCTVTV